MRSRIILAGVIVIGLALTAFGGVAWVAFGPNTPDFDGERSVHIPPGSGLDAIIDSLRTEGVVRSASSFRIVARASGWGNQIKAGHYTFSAGTSNHGILDKLRRGLQQPVRLTIPAGARPPRASAVAAQHMFFEPAAFGRAVSDPRLADELVTDTLSLFGYMLPETYHFYWLTSAEQAVRTIKKEFDRFFERELRARADSLGLSKQDVVTLASIIEWETGEPLEKPMISGVYHNRLRRGMKLDADPTVQYAILQREGQKRRLFYADYRIEHPFNTYLHRGLPPAPLNNPSPSSLRAAVQPTEHEFLYFVAVGDGTHHFSKTLAEHNRAARRYHALMRERRRAANSAGE